MNKTYRIISYNIHSGKNIYMLPQLRQVVKFLEKQQADIIGVQEIHQNNKKGYQVSYVADNLGHNVCFSPNVPIGAGYYGVATFSHYPITGEHILLQSIGEQRGLLNSMITLEQNRIMHILNTHLSLKYNERKIQITEINKYIKQLSYPFILLGDFNTDKTNIDSFLIDSAATMNKEHLPTMMLFNKRIDYIYLSSGLKAVNYEVKYEKMSDHFPVVVDFSFTS